jgi:hypothetical protein
MQHGIVGPVDASHAPFAKRPLNQIPIIDRLAGGQRLGQNFEGREESANLIHRLLLARVLVKSFA